MRGVPFPGSLLWLASQLGGGVPAEPMGRDWLDMSLVKERLERRAVVGSAMPGRSAPGRRAGLGRLS